MTLLIGSEGSMGKRYQAILKYFGEPFDGADFMDGFGLKDDQPDFEKFDRFIIASPTRTHLDWVLRLEKYGKPILCEKPLSTKRAEIARILDCEAPLSMMMQYQHILSRGKYGTRSYYDYFRTGNDGLKWDCFQIIALSQARPEIKNESPIWTCALNGQILSLADMDLAYVVAVRDFLAGHYISKSQLLEWHAKVSEFQL